MTKTELRDLFMIGMRKAFNKLLEEKQLHDGELVFSKNGKIVTIKARDVKPLE
jgi:hypothetical protein